MMDYMIDYMMEGVSAYLIFIVCWGLSYLITMNVIEWINKKRKNKKK